MHSIYKPQNGKKTYNLRPAHDFYRKTSYRESLSSKHERRCIYVKFGHALLENIIENLNTAIAGNIWREHGQNASTLFFFFCCQ